MDDRTSVVDLCEAAAKNLICENNIAKEEIDTIIFASTSHDYHAPASSCLVHGRLDFPESCNCFDISGVSCSGYVYALWVAHGLIQSGASKKCLLLAGDTNSKHTNINNRDTALLYSDAGTATLLEYTNEEKNSYFFLGSKGKDWDKIIAPSTGHKLQIRDDIASVEIKDTKGNVWHFWEDILSGMDVFRFSMKYAPYSIEQLLNYSKKEIKDIDFFPMHQANGQMVEMIAKHANIPDEKYSYETFTKYANSGISAVTTNLCDMLHGKKLNEIMLVTFGVGLSWGSAILNFENTSISDIAIYKSKKENLNRKELIEYWANAVKNK